MKRSELIFTLCLVPLDFVALLSAGIGAFFLRFHPYFIHVRPVIFSMSLDRYIAVILPIAVVWMLIFAVCGLYSTRRTPLAQELMRIALACSASMAVVFAILFFSRQFFESRFIAVAAWILAIVCVCALRLLLRALQRALLGIGIGQHRVVMIGSGQSAHVLQRTFSVSTHLGVRIVGHFPKFNPEIASRIVSLTNKYGVDELLLTDPNVDPTTRLKLLTFTESHHIDFTYTADLFAAAVGRSVNHTVAGIPIIEVRRTRLDGWGKVYKRLFDILGASVLIFLSSPLMLAVALTIKLDSPGPILFHMNRVGQEGRLFRYFKFRTMIPNAHDQRYSKLSHLNTRSGPLVKIHNDPRITRVGTFLRTYSLDELPEFFLVLRGHMSLVGPRPHLPEEVERYADYQRKVLTIKPGITGMAQISGRETLDFDEEVRLDTFYIEHWSPFLDFYILLKTPLVVLFQKQAS